jgi:NAD(P)-dependent dehydrogenase (short-subunit alcohol dehydrogenase family)
VTPPGHGLLDGSVAVVSGVGRGLGRAICRSFLAEGAFVVAGDVDPECLDELVRDPELPAGRLSTQVTDISRLEDCERLAARAADTYGRIDVLVNDAYHPGDFLRFADADLEVWRQVGDVNIWGTLRMTRAVLPAMSAQGQGRVIMIVTQGVEWIQDGGFGAYTGTKASIAHYVRLLATELGPAGVRVNGVFPGPIWGPALQGYLQTQADERGVHLDTVYTEWAQDMALRRLVTPEDVAGSVVFLASDLAESVTGQALYVNAGQWFH